MAQIAEKTAERAQCNALALNVICTVLGVPKPTPIGGDLGPGGGGAVGLRTPSGDRAEHMLCAHVVDDVWICHSGSLAGCELDEDEPFQEKDLIKRDTVQAAFHQKAPPPAKRVRIQAKASPLRDAALRQPWSWSRAVAAATW